MRTQNEKRADRAYRTVLGHRSMVGDRNADHQTVLVDLLTDLLHLQDDGSVDVADALRIAHEHYQTETGTTADGYHDPVRATADDAIVSTLHAIFREPKEYPDGTIEDYQINGGDLVDWLNDVLVSPFATPPYARAVAAGLIYEAD